MQEVQQKFADTLRISLQSAFGIEAPTSLTLEEQYAVFEGKASIEEMCRRLKDGQYKQIIIMTGAGISVSAGIPDFRSPGTGFYDKLDLTKYDLPSPQSVFELDYFRQNPRAFVPLLKSCTLENIGPLLLTISLNFWLARDCYFDATLRFVISN